LEPLVDFIFGALFMRILMVGINYAPDLIGVAKYNTELCEALASLGHDVRIVTAPPYYPEWTVPAAYRGWFYRSETVSNVAITRSPIYVPNTPSGARRLVHHASFALTSAWPVISQALRWRPDIVFSVAPSRFRGSTCRTSRWTPRSISAS
jgi:colanic acid biosynthesis glycosyl transferase WcaI